MSNDTITSILSEPVAKRSGVKTGKAPAIRALKTRYPEMTMSEIGRRVGCTQHNVSVVLSRFLGDTGEDDLRDYQENQADVFDSLAHRLLSSLTEDKINKTKVMEAVTAAAILTDKARLVRGQATGINVSVMHQLIEEIRADDSRNPIVINAIPTIAND